MIKELVQKKGLNFRKFYLYDDKIVIEERTSSKITKYDIELDEIGYKFFYEKENTNIGKIATWILATIPLILIIAYLLGALDGAPVIINSIVWGGLAIFGFVKQNKDDLILGGGQKAIFFYRNKPNEEAVMFFINKLIETSKKHIKKKYLMFKEYETDEEIINRLRWMLSIEVLSNKEYDIIREELKNRSLF